MPKDNENKQAAAGGYQHPCATHDQDECVAEVVFPQGVRENGRVYRPGEKLILNRRHIEAQNKPGRPVYRIVKTLKYINDPNAVSTATTYEDQVQDGPLEIS